MNSCAMALTDTKPALRSFPIVGPKASALKSATGLNARLLLVPSCADVSRRSRVSIRLTELRCHRPPKAPVIPLRFNSFARPRSVAKPAAISFRMVGSKARARGSAAPLLANAPRIPRLRDVVSARTCSIEESWPDFEATAYAKIMSNPHEQLGCLLIRFVGDQATRSCACGPPKAPEVTLPRRP